MNRLMKKKKYFFLFLSSYIILLIFFLSVCFYVYYQALSFIKSEIVSSHYSTISRLSQSVDAKITDMEWISSELVLNKEIIAQSSLENASIPNSRTALMKIPDQLRIYPSTRSYIKDIFVTFPQRQMIISGHGTCDFNEYVEIYFPHMSNDKQDLIRSLSGKNLNNLTVINSDKNGVERNDILLLRSVEYEPGIIEYSNVGILLNGEFFDKLYGFIKMEGLGNILILDSMNNVIYSSEKISDADLEITETFSKKMDMFDATINGEENKVLYTTDYREMKYVALIPLKSFAQKALPIQNVMMYSILVYVLFGLVGAVLFSLRNYKPIKGIMTKFSHLSKIDENSYDEYTIIEKMISNIANENNIIKHSYNKQKNILRDFFLLKLLKGYTSANISDDDILTTYNINFPENGFTVIMFYLESVPDIAGYGTEDEEECVGLAEFIMLNVAEECCTSKFIYNCCFESDGAIFAIINTPSNEDNQQNIKEVIDHIYEIVNGYFKTNFSTFISDCHNSLEGISECYKECMEAAEYKIVIEAAKIIYYKDIIVNDNSTVQNIYPFEQQKKFTNMVKSGELVGAKEIIQDAFDKINEHDGLLLEEAKCLMITMINTMVNIFDDSIFLEKLNVIKRLVKCKSLAMLNKEMLDILDEIEDDYIKKQKSDNIGKIVEITNYIQSNSNNDTLSLTSIAEYFEMNPSYLSRYYKEQAGEGLLYTINKIRVENSKELLMENDMTLKEIAQKVGFVNDAVLIRTFKKYEGITPGNFRKCKKMLQ